MGAARVHFGEVDGDSASEHRRPRRPKRTRQPASLAGWGSASLPLLLFSHACTALLTFLLTSNLGLHPNLHFAPLHDESAVPNCQPPLTTIASTPSSTSLLIPSALPTPLVDLCDSAVAYPVSVPSSITGLCHQARPLRYPFHRSQRYHRRDVVMSLLTVDAYKWDRDEACLSTWMTPLRTPFAYFGVGIPRPAELQQPTVQLPNTRDTYLSNLNKTFLVLRELYRQHPNHAWYMQTSDDAYIDVDTLLLRLEELDSDKEWYVGGAMGGGQCWLTGKELSYVGGGLGFLVSRGFLRKWAEDIEGWMATQWASERGVNEPTYKWGDVMVGCYMQQKEVAVTHILGGHPEIPLTDNMDTLGRAEYPRDNERWWGYHHADAEQLFDIHALFTLQRIDQLQAQKQLTELALHAREWAMELWHSNRRQLARLRSFLDHPNLLAKSAEVEQPP